MNKDEAWFMFFVGIIFSLIVMFVTLFVVEPTQDERYQKNVCTYLGGQVQGLVCIVDKKVVDIPAAR